MTLCRGVNDTSPGGKGGKMNKKWWEDGDNVEDEDAWEEDQREDERVWWEE